MWVMLRTLGIWLVVLHVAAATATGQTYRIDLERLPTLTRHDDAPCLVENELTYGVRDAQGRFVVYSTPTDRLTVFAADGQCLREVGRQGSGPNEYTEIVSVQPYTDSLVVYDLGNNRVSVLGPTLEIQRSFNPPVPLGMRLRLAPDGTIIANLRLRTPEATGYPLHRFSNETGAYIGSVGSAPDRYSEDTSDTSRKFFVGQVIWEAWPKEWVFRAWSLEGEHLQTLRPTVPTWFPGPEVDFDYSLRSPPRPRIQGLWLDKDNRLWVMTRVPGDNWEAGVAEEDGQRTIKDRNEFYGTALHVLDVGSGEILASARVDGFATMIEPGMLGLVEYTLGGLELSYTVIRPRLSVF